MLLGTPALASREQVAHVIRGDRAAVREQVLRRKQAEDTHQATSVVGVHVRQCHEVKVAHVVLPEKRGNQRAPVSKRPSYVPPPSMRRV